MFTDKQIEAVGKVAEATGKTVDFIDKTLGTVPADVVGLAGGDWLHEFRRRNTERLKAKTARILEEEGLVPQEPSPSLVIPLITASADEGREELQDMWAALLAKAMTSDSKFIRRGFFDAIQKMEPTDILVFRTVAKHTLKGTAITGAIEQELTAMGIDTNAYQVSLEALIELKCIRRDMNNAIPRISSFGKLLLDACTVRPRADKKK